VGSQAYEEDEFMKAIILAGGSGTRLWPLSRKHYPKQFLKINGDLSLLQQTAERVMKILPWDDIIVMTNREYRFHVKADMTSLPSAGATVFDNIILEPASRNTAPAIALGIAYCRDKLGAGDDEVLFVCPSDHIIRPDERFAEYVRCAEKIAQEGYLVTFGVTPDQPETGYGYIKKGRRHSLAGSEDFFEVEAFAEKPDIETAKTYLNGGYLWNAGMFAFTIRSMTDELKQHAPEIGSMLELNFEAMVLRFTEMPNLSVDYAVMEKSARVATLPLDIYWNDIGSWDSLYDVLDKNGQGNVALGDISMLDTKNCLIIGNKRLISTIGMEDCLIVDTEDALLISKKGETQKVKDVVGKLKQEARTEVEEHVYSYRPWGSFMVLEEGPRYKIKRIVVNPAERLSLQMHYHRSEHWVVVKGTAKVLIGDKELLVHENESVYVPKSTIHRLENPGKVSLEIIEVQNGEYLGEDDIIRTDDRYGRQDG
jgi:mannose-1-phosphate guanylyltransferase/mannose-6-phosphate isomerase